MKRLFFFVALIVSFSSCETKNNSESSTTNLLENFSFSVDTVTVDVGEEIFMPGAYYKFELSEDGDQVFTYFEPEFEVHEIDLNAMKLVKRHKFEKDGPNMIPMYLNYMQNLNETELFFANSNQAGVFKKTGEKVKSISLKPEDYSGLDPDFPFSLGNSILISPDQKKVLTLPNESLGTAEGLAILNLEAMNAKFLKLPALEMTKNFRVLFKQGNGAVSSGENQRLYMINGQFIIDSGATSDIYIYDLVSDSLRLVTFPHQLVPKAKTREFPSEVDSNERRREVMNEIRKQISFSQFFWDEGKQIYFRMGEMNRELNEATKRYSSDTYLFTYDKDFNLTGETKVQDLDFMPTYGFARDNKLYMEWVVGENPAFIVYTFNF
ncbi:DUF4221 family protein [Algoriphagus yeomjeoni]|uniref:Uncharacterized protein DUF4221 n=1 Tax=Algoriphagus yeomjeoni TaxID=291403 RepID=A0A327PSN5_9BACT|nr:DUF4221 family protein [Algoriphagus yeomjeoni]RAI95178.1 uncharacterized protein DUF4221 [Algoriphagus yeomjeoni]